VNNAYCERSFEAAALAFEWLAEIELVTFGGHVFDATPYFHTELNPKGHRRHIWQFKRWICHSADTEFQVVGERELRTVADSLAVVEVNVLDGSFAQVSG
jgi:hypothetical protein